MHYIQRVVFHYKTLEPCTHYGLTPPCVDIIKKKKIKNVYYGFEDPDYRTHKKAKNILKKEGIFSKLIKIKKFKNFYNSYFFNKKFKLLFITSKIAISKDYFSINKKSQWITNNRSKKITHLLRSKYDCIFSTSKTINKDNSLLNCRIDGLNNFKPDLFIIDLKLKLKKNLLLNNMINKRQTYLITSNNNKKKITYYKKKGFKIILIKSLDSKNDFQILFKFIYKLGYSRAFFETGLTFLNLLLSYKLINNLYIFQSAIKLKKNGLNNDSFKLLKKIKLNNKIKINLNDDNLYEKKF